MHVTFPSSALHSFVPTPRHSPSAQCVAGSISCSCNRDLQQNKTHGSEWWVSRNPPHSLARGSGVMSHGDTGNNKLIFAPPSLQWVQMIRRLVIAIVVHSPLKRQPRCRRLKRIVSFASLETELRLIYRVLTLTYRPHRFTAVHFCAIKSLHHASQKTVNLQPWLLLTPLL